MICLDELNLFLMVIELLILTLLAFLSIVEFLLLILRRAGTLVDSLECMGEVFELK